MKPNILGVHHIALKACGMDAWQRLLDFYHQTLGLAVVRRWGEGAHLGAMLDTGNALLELFSDGENEAGEGALRHVALATDNVDACIAAVRAAGYTVTMEPTDIVIGSVPPCPARIAFCVGPVGESVEFFAER